MNKKLNVVLITVWSCILVFLIAIFVYGMKNQGMSFDFVEQDIEASTGEQTSKEYTFDTTQIDNIEIDLSSENIDFISTNEKDIKMIYKADSNTQKHEKLIVKQAGGTIKVYKNYFRRNFFFNLNFRQAQLDIYLPKEYNKDLLCDLSSGSVKLAHVAMKDIVIDQSSGNIDIEDVISDNLKIEQTSGNVNIKKLTSNTLEVDKSSGETEMIEAKVDTAYINSTSGNVQCEKIEAAELECESSSGCREFENCTIDKISCSSTSGEVNIEGQYKEVMVDSSSGSSKLKFKTMPHTIEIYKTSGDTALYLPENANFNLEYDKTSGDFNSEFDLKQSFEEDNDHISASYGTGENNITVEGSSGNLKLKKLS